MFSIWPWYRSSSGGVIDIDEQLVDHVPYDVEVAVAARYVEWGAAVVSCPVDVHSQLRRQVAHDRKVTLPARQEERRRAEIVLSVGV